MRGAPTMTPEFLSWLQFALTASFHFVWRQSSLLRMRVRGPGSSMFRGKVRLTGDSY